MLKCSWTMYSLNYITNNEVSNIKDSDIDMFHTTLHLNISAGGDAAEIVLVDDSGIMLLCAKLKQRAQRLTACCPARENEMNSGSVEDSATTS